MKEFVFEALVDRENICNLSREAEQILEVIDSGRRAVIYGRRNTGKTSLIQNPLNLTLLL